MTSAIKVLNRVETAAVANCTWSAWKSSYTPSFTAAVAIHIPYNTSLRSMHISHLCFVLYYQLTLAVAVFIFHGKLYVTTCSVELQNGGVHAMNNVILTKWRIALSINIGVLENH